MEDRKHKRGLATRQVSVPPVTAFGSGGDCGDGPGSSVSSATLTLVGASPSVPSFTLLASLPLQTGRIILNFSRINLRTMMPQIIVQSCSWSAHLMTMQQMPPFQNAHGVRRVCMEQPGEASQ